MKRTSWEQERPPAAAAVAVAARQHRLYSAIRSISETRSARNCIRTLIQACDWTWTWQELDLAQPSGQRQKKKRRKSSGMLQEEEMGGRSDSWIGDAKMYHPETQDSLGQCSAQQRTERLQRRENQRHPKQKWWRRMQRRTRKEEQSQVSEPELKKRRKNCLRRKRKMPQILSFHFRIELRRKDWVWGEDR